MNCESEWKRVRILTIIDTRNPQAWSQSDVKLPEAIRPPFDISLTKNLSKIPKDKPVVAYCT